MIKLLYGLLFWRQFLTTFLEAVFKESSPVSSNCFLYFLENDKNLYPLTYFLVLGSTEYCCIAELEGVCHFYLSIGNVKLTLSSISNHLPF